MNTETAEKIDVQNLRDIVPASWLERRAADNTIWVTGYSVFGVSKEQLISKQIIDLGDIRIIIFYGTVNYIEFRQGVIESVGKSEFRFNAKIRGNVTPEGMYLLLLTPSDLVGDQNNEVLTREKMSYTTGLLAVLAGRNLVYQRLFDNIVDLITGRVTGFTPSIENPLWFAKPDVSESGLIRIIVIDKAIQSVHHRNKILLSLRWFESAIYERGVDAYIKYWFALETLAMQDTNIKPIEDILAKIYNLSQEDTRKRFGVGRLFGLRSRIVHDGAIVPIHAELTRYIEALYADVLFFQLALQSERRAEKVLNNPTFNLGDHLYES